MSTSVHQLVGRSLKPVTDHRIGHDLLVDGINAIWALRYQVPLFNMLASGNVEHQLKALMAAGIQRRRSSVLFVMDKQFELTGRQTKQQVDLLLMDSNRQTIAVECKCTFAFDTRRSVICDALDKGRLNFALDGVRPTRSSIVHFLNDTRFGDRLDELPDRLRARFEKLYVRPAIQVEALLSKYCAADEGNLINAATVVTVRSGRPRISCAALILDLKRSNMTLRG